MDFVANGRGDFRIDLGEVSHRVEGADLFHAALMPAAGKRGVEKRVDDPARFGRPA